MTRPAVVARRIGNEQATVVIVDGFHPDPDALRAAAIDRAFAPARQHYPGVRAELPDDYFARVRPVLAPVLREVFGATTIELLDASFSIVTTPPAQLSLEQRVPHVDAIEAGRIALVHYLAPAGAAGTAFFRHRATGFERIDAARAPTYYARLTDELRADVPTGYMSTDSAYFERIAHVEGDYNRAVIYASALLHSGAIDTAAAPDPDPATGRLTVTGFLSIA